MADPKDIKDDPVQPDWDNDPDDDGDGNWGDEGDEDDNLDEGGDNEEPDAPPSVEPPPSSEKSDGGGDDPPPPASPPEPTPAEVAAKARVVELEAGKREADALAQKVEAEGRLNSLTNEAGVRYNKLIKDGAKEELARESAGNWLESKKLELVAEYQNKQNQSRDKELYALRLVAQHGGSVDDLLAYDTPEAMKAAATKNATTSKEVLDLRQRVIDLEKGKRPPVQKMAGSGSGGTPVTSLDKKARAYGRSGGPMTSEEYENWKASR